MDKEKSWPTAAGLALALLAMLLLEGLLFPYLVDDSFISYRYAENLAEGKGLVFNPGERVEGYSNFLWVVLLAGFVRLGLDPVVASKILGILSSIGSVLLIYLISRRVSERKGSFVLVSVLLTATDIGFVRWSVAGMETQLASLLLLGSLFLLLRETEGESRLPLSGLLLGLASLTRPEAPLLFLAALAVRVARRGRKWSPDDTMWLVAYFVVVVPYLLFRFSYYGSMLPNSYYAKTGGGLKRIVVGIRYANQFFQVNGGYALLPILAFPLASRRRDLYPLYLFLAAQLFFIVYVGGDHMDDFRFFVPVLGIVFILAQEALLQATRLLSRWRTGILVLAVLGLLASNLAADYFATLVAWWGDSRTQLALVKSGAFSPEESYDRARVGVWLKENVPEDLVIAVEDCGMIPYYSGVRTIDMFGLMDAHLSHLAGMMHQKFDASYILDRKPDIVILIRYPAWSGNEPFWQSRIDRDLAGSPRFGKEYALLQRIEGRERWFLIYERSERIELQGLH